MVYFYKIRGGQCRQGGGGTADYSSIELKPTDIICYVGRDKHENEHLIKYGWPGDIWFHVEGLSSAHVYFRLKIGSGNSSSSGSSNTDSDDSNYLFQKLLIIHGNNSSNSHSNSTTNEIGMIPIDNLPAESIEDMCQIVKHNSISGCKQASCKIVYTPHSNLKKTFEMEAGAVTYHDSKLQRFKRCDKDRVRIKELEKGKSQDINVNYYEEMKNNERIVIELRKKYKKLLGSGGGSVDIYDPMKEDLKGMKSKASQQGDKLSGLDSGLAGLESLGLITVIEENHNRGGGGGGGGGNIIQNNTNSNSIPIQNPKKLQLPVWEKEANERVDNHKNERTRFLLARGYTIKQINTVMEDSLGDKEEFSVTLSKLWNNQNHNQQNNDDDDVITKEQLYESRFEEREVLEAIYGDDEHVQFGWKTNDESDSNDEDHDDSDSDSDNEEESDPSKPFPFDSIYPITGYEPPKRYEYPPPLLLEVYVDQNVSMYPYYQQSPVVAIVGGGIPSKYLRLLTQKIHESIMERAQDSEPGEPYIYDVIQLVSEYAKEIVDIEDQELEKERKIAVKKAKLVADQQAKDEGFIPDLQTTTTSKLVFNSKADQHAYAKSIVAKGGISSGGGMSMGNRGGPATNTSADNTNNNTTDSKSSYPKKKLYGTDAEAAQKREIDDRYR